MVSDLNRYFNKPIVLGDPELADLSVTGTFRLNEQSTVLDALGSAFCLTVEEYEDSLVLVRGNTD